MLMSLTATDFKEYIDRSEYSAVVFLAEHCPPSRMFCGVFNRVAKDNTDVNFFKVNLDNEEELAKKYSVQIAPTVVFFKKGQQKSKFQGLVGEKTLLWEIKKLQQ